MATALAPPPTTSLLSTDSALYPPQIDEANHVIRELGLALDGLGHSASFIRFKRPVNELAVQSPRVRQPLAASPASPVNTADVAVNMAAMYVDAALKGRKFEGFDNNEFVGGKDVRWRSSRVTYYHILHSRAWRVIYVTVCLLHIALALAEAPALIPCPRAIAFAVEWLCLAVYAIDLLFSYRVSHSFASFAMQRWRAARCGLLLAIAVDVVVGMSIPGSYRFSRGLRPFMLIFRLRNVRKVFAACASTLRRALLIYTLIGFLTTLFGFVGYSLMASTCTDGHLSHITTALYHLLLLQTTLGVFATEMLPYYVASKWSLLFFLTFAVIVNLLVAKMVIAVGYDSYRSYMRGKILKHVAMRDQALSVAYKLLDAGDGVTLDSWMALCAQLKRPDDLTARVLFHSVCGEGECEAVDMRQFAELCLRVNAKAVAKRRVAVDTRLQRGLAHTRVRLQRMMRRTLTLLETELNYFDMFMSGIVACSLVCVVAAVREKRSLGYVTSTTVTFNLCILLAFSAEVLVKLYAYGFQRFWRDGIRRLDVIITVIGILDWLYFGYSRHTYSSVAGSVWFHFCNAVASLRLLKAFAAIQIGASLSRTLFRILPAVMNILCIIAAVVYALALLGMEWYSGTNGDERALIPDNPRLVNATQWQALAPVMEFNNLADGMLTVFQVAVVANWFIVLDAAVLTVGGGSGLSGYLYFFSVRLILGTLLLPVFFGFVIEAFNNNLPVVLTEQRARREAMLSELSELQNMSEDPQTFLYDTAREFDGVHAGERLPDTGTPLLSDVGPAGSQPLPLLSRVKSRLVDVGDGGNSDTRSDSRRSRASMSSGSGKQPPDWKEYVLKSKPKASDIQTALFVSSSSGFQLQAPPAAPSRSRSAVFGDVDKPLVSGEGEMARMAAALESERKGHEEAKQRIQTLEQELALLRQKKGRRG